MSYPEGKKKSGTLMRFSRVPQSLLSLQNTRETFKRYNDARTTPQKSIRNKISIPDLAKPFVAFHLTKILHTKLFMQSSVQYFDQMQVSNVYSQGKKNQNIKAFLCV